LRICCTTSCTTKSTTNLQLIVSGPTSPQQIHNKVTVYSKSTTSRHCSDAVGPFNKSTSTSPQHSTKSYSLYKKSTTNPRLIKHVEFDLYADCCFSRVVHTQRLFWYRTNFEIRHVPLTVSVVIWKLLLLFAWSIADAKYILVTAVCVCVPVCVSLCLSVLRRIPTLLYGPGCNLGEW